MDPDKLTLLFYSQARRDRDTASLDIQKADMKDVYNHYVHKMNAYPCVALADGGAIVSYNRAVSVPQAWIDDAPDGKLDGGKLPAPRYVQPGQYDDYGAQATLFRSLGLTAAQAEDEEARVEVAKALEMGGVLQAQTQSFKLLRDRNGIVQPGGTKFDLPPVEAVVAPLAPQASTDPKP